MLLEIIIYKQTFEPFEAVRICLSVFEEIFDSVHEFKSLCVFVEKVEPCCMKAEVLGH